MTTVAVLDYGMGNLHSVAKALEHVGAARVHVTSDPAIVRAADRVVLPGQGAMRDCMAEMQQHGVDNEVRDIIAAGSKPLLGICVGMQALLQHSDENAGVDGLGIYPGAVRFFADATEFVASRDHGERLKVPHMGWNEVWQAQEHPLWASIPDAARFYFVHSYYCVPAEVALVSGRSTYGIDFACALARDNVFAVQFHPEKSSRHGLQLLRNFISWQP